MSFRALISRLAPAAPQGPAPDAPEGPKALTDGALRPEPTASHLAAQTKPLCPPVAASARLHLQLPLGEATDAAGWIGGAPDLPPDQPWPTHKGRNQVFLLQLDCAALPVDLWGGQGPRDGWLSVFADPETAQATVLHTASKGTKRAGPPLHSALWFRAEDRDDEDMIAPDLRQLGLTEWPIALRAVAQGQTAPVPRHPMFAPLQPAAPAAFDAAAPGHRPFDWPTAFAVLRAVAQMLCWHQARWQRTKASLPRDRAILSVLIKRLRTETAGLLDLISAANAAAGETDFDDNLWALLCEGLDALTLPTARRLPVAEAQARSQTFELTAPTPVLANMTTHFWQPYRRFLRSYAAQAQATGTPLPPAVLEVFAPEWVRIAQTEPLGLGNRPAALGLMARDPDMQVLFDIPSSDFFGWCWGIDMENLVICLSGADLAAGRFDRTVTRIAC